jgi:hypothetical protein
MNKPASDLIEMKPVKRKQDGGVFVGDLLDDILFYGTILPANLLVKTITNHGWQRTLNPNQLQERICFLMIGCLLDFSSL